MSFTELITKRRKLSTTLMQLAMAASPLSVSAAAAAYYSGRRNAYGASSHTTYLVDPRLVGEMKKASQPVSESADLTIRTAPVKELLVVDQQIIGHWQFNRLVKPGVQLVEIPRDADGLAFLLQLLEQYRHLDAVHLFSHAHAGELRLGSTLVNSRMLKDHPTFAQVLNSAVKTGGDLLLYGCELAKGEAGDELLEIIKATTHVDVAASDNLTGNAALGGDWELEITKGDINVKPLADSVAMKDFTTVLQLDTVITMDGVSAGYSADKEVTYEGYTARFWVDQTGNEDEFRVSGGRMYVRTLVNENTVYEDYSYTDYHLVYYGARKVYFGFAEEELFDITSLELEVWNGQRYLISSDKGNSEEVKSTGTVELDWKGITKLTIEEVDGSFLETGFYLDNFVLKNIERPNQPPTISGSPATSVNQDEAYSFIPTAADIDGDALTFSIDNKPDWAEFDAATGELSGTPGNADVGTTEGIVIMVSDGKLSTPLPAFNLEVVNVNDAPTISGSPATSVNQDEAYSFIPMAEDIDDDALTYSIDNKPDWAEFDAATGELSGTPGNADVGTTEGIVIMVSDGKLSTSLPAFNLEVVNVNDAPTISGSPATSVNQDEAYSFIPMAEDIDDDALTFSITNQPDWAEFNTATGELSGTPGNADVGTTEGIVIMVSDGELSASLPAFNLEVVNVNDAPTISGSPATSVNQDEAYSFIPMAEDIDDDALIFSITNQPDWAAFDAATGELSGTPGNADVGTTEGIVITVSDGELSASLPAFDLEVVNVNDAPTISGSPATSVNQDEAYSFIPMAEDIDDDALTYSITNQPDWAEFDAATGELSGTPGNADVGTTEGVVITVSDGELSASLPAFNLEVVNVNDAPTISGSPATSVNQDEAYSFIPTAEDIDDDALTYSITNQPDWAEFNTATGELSGTPGNADVGTTEGIVIMVSDGELSASLPAFDLEVVNVNDAPTISGSPATSVNQDEAYSFIPTAEDIDDDVLTFSIDNKPDWAAFDAATGELSGTPGNADVGTTEGIVITVSDGELSASLPAFNLEVVNVNDAPTISGSPATSVNQDEAYSFIPMAEDIDGDALTYSVTNQPDWAAFDTATGELSGTPGNADVGTTEGIVITVSDGELNASLPAFDLEVTTKVITGVTLTDGSFVYDGVPKALHIEGDLPTHTQVTYSNNSRVGVGRQTVTATIAGIGYTTLALTAELTVTPAERTLNFPALPLKTYGDAAFNAEATASSGETVSYTSSNPAVAEVAADGTITITDVGETIITATVPENGNYTSRPSVSQTLTVAKAAQTITFAEVGELRRDAGTIPLAVSSSSGLPVELTIDDEEVATLSGTSLNVLRLGTVRITATQAGDANHEPADPVTVIVRVTDPSADLPVRVQQAVSPNGDGINDYLIIEAIKDYPDNRVSIFNRNGTVVWEASGYNNSTVAFRGIGTGQYNVPAGTYFYVAEIRVGNEWKYEKGWFVLRY